MTVPLSWNRSTNRKRRRSLPLGDADRALVRQFVDEVVKHFGPRTEPVLIRPARFPDAQSGKRPTLGLVGRAIIRGPGRIK